MTETRDYRTMIEALTMAIARQESEAEFFLRSAEKSTSKAAKMLFREIARDLGAYRDALEARRRDLVEAAAREGRGEGEER